MEKTIAEKLLKEHIETLNTEYEHYKEEYDTNKDYKTTSDMLRDLDIDSIEFNAGFEQGYMRALEEIINTI